MRTALGLDPQGDSNVVIVTVDEKSVNKLGRWPWNRRVVGDLFAKMNQAGIIGLDIVFSEETEPEKDRYLADKIAENGNIILGFFFRDRASEETTPEDVDLIQECAYFDYKLLDSTVGVKNFNYSEINIPVLSELLADPDLSCAFFTTEPDVDGFYRKYPLAYVHKGYIFPPLAVQMLRYHLNKDAQIVFDSNGVVSFKLDNVLLKRTNRFRINFYDIPSITVVPAVDILEGQVAPAFFKDKVVLVGVTEIGVFDMRPTPINPVTPGVLLHYTAFLNLLRNEMVHDAQWVDIVLLIISMALVLSISLRQSLFQRLVLYLSLVLFCLLFAQYLFIVHLVWIREFYIITPVFFCMAALEIVAFVYTEMRAGELKRAFSSYVSPDIVQEILKDPDRLKLGGEEREITILFSDIRRFTSLSESVTPVQLVQILTRIHDPMTNVVLHNKGMLDKYIGDAMMALFNTPIEVENHADKAVHSSLEMVKTLHAINKDLSREGLPTIDVGVGINTGKAVVGNMGSRMRFEYTAIGDAVNLASRLEGLCKTYRTRIVISEYTKNKLVDDFLIRRLDKVQVKGKTIPVEVYEVMDDTAGNRAVKDAFERGLAYYCSRDFEAARAIFEELVMQNDDKVSTVFAARCRMFAQNNPGAEWDGVFTMDTK
jgi:adenylate cyclase